MATKTLPPENSITLRVVCCLMAIIAVTASFIFGESAVPVVEFSLLQLAIVFMCIWLCVGGGIFSYFYRQTPPAVVSKLIKVGAALIIINLGRELWNDNLVSLQFQFVRPLMHALVAASVLTSFELRTRGDIISSATFGLLLLSVAATSGKSMLFGIFVFLYICLGAALLMLSCYSQTQNEIAGKERKSLVKQTTKGNTKLATGLLVLLLPTASVALFCILPRLDNEADSVSAQVRSAAASTIYSLRQQQHNGDPVPASLLSNQPGKQSVGPNRLKAARQVDAIKRQKKQEASAFPIAEAKKETKSTAKMAEPKTSKAAETAKTESESPKKEVPQPKPTQPTPGESNAAQTKPPSAKPSPQKPEKTAPDTAAPPPVPVVKKKPLDDHVLDVSDGISDPEEPLFTLASNRSVYTKTLALDHFDGTRWTRHEVGDQVWFYRPEVKGISLDCPPFAMSSALPIVEVAQTFKIENDLGHAVPIAGIPQQLALLQPVTVDAFGNIWANENLKKGTEYSVVGEVPVYSLKAMREAAPPEVLVDAEDQYLEMPEAESPKLTELALEIAGNDGNRFARAERVMMHLRKNYKYEQAPVTMKTDAKYVDNFLFEKKAGDCKAFASSFILMCRAIEIPARCVTGYLPGDFDPVTGATHVKRKHSHAWAEVYIPPYGWVPFDPTPNGMLPARPEETYYNAERLRKELENYRKQANARTEEVIKKALDWAGIVIGVIAFGVSSFALYLALRAARGVFRTWIKTARRKHPASKIRDKLTKRLQKVGVVSSPSDTGADLVNKLRACALSSKSPGLEGKVEEFMHTFNAAYFGRESRIDELKSLDKEIAALLRGARKER